MYVYVYVCNVINVYMYTIVIHFNIYLQYKFLIDAHAMSMLIEQHKKLYPVSHPSATNF